MTDYEKMKNIIDEIDVLVENKVTCSSPEFKAWNSKTERFLIKVFGTDSLEHKSFKDTKFTFGFYFGNTTHSDFVEKCKKDLTSTKAIFQTYLEEMKEENTSNYNNHCNTNFSRIFIVHGHDDKLKESVARIIEKQDIEVIILSEKANQGRTIIEKFEDYSDVCGAICLFTADDVGKAKSESEEKTRARQNVVLETGYFMGKLGRNRVVILTDKGIEMPSDLSGVVYTNTQNWQIDLLKDLKAMGYNVDFNKLF